MGIGKPALSQLWHEATWCVIPVKGQPDNLPEPRYECDWKGFHQLTGKEVGLGYPDFERILREAYQSVIASDYHGTPEEMAEQVASFACDLLRFEVRRLTEGAP